MSALISILRAVHCRSTHHFFAIDALDRINTPNGRRLASVLLANYAEYLGGAKAPDTKFKDFQNHVIHVSDNHWGGAPQTCEKWLAQIIVDMHESEWKKAAYGIGVLSHYFTDPLMPLHTAQHPSEAAVHRPLEWSVCKSYDRIFRKCTGQVQFPLATGPRWISKAVIAGAEIAHRHYETLIELYDLERGAKDPPAGFDSRSREILTEIFDYALTGWANILDRVAALALVEIPICPLTFTTVMAAADVPVAYVIGRISDAAEQRAVKAIFEEYKATGQVVRNLPPELKMIESLKPAPAKQTDAVATKTSAVAPAAVAEPVAVPVNDAVPSPVQEFVHEERVEKTECVQATHASGIEAVRMAAEAEEVQFEPMEQDEEKPTCDSAMSVEPVATKQTPSLQRTAVTKPPKSTESKPSGSRLTLDSDIVDAPSIGPKTAARFYDIGIHTIGDFLAADAAEMALALNARWMDEQVLMNWQAQTRLVLYVPALCGYKAQLLVGIDCSTVEELAQADLTELHRAIARFARTDAGLRILRSGTEPTVDEVAKWIASAAEAEVSSDAPRA